jgi:hypothetical protein
VVGEIWPQGAVALASGFFHYLEFKYGQNWIFFSVFGKHILGYSYKILRINPTDRKQTFPGPKGGTTLQREELP